MKTTPLHWYRGEQDRGNNVCGTGTNRTDWTDRETTWNAPENASRRCRACETGRQCPRETSRGLEAGHYDERRTKSVPM